MGSRINFALALAGAIVLVAGIVLFVNIAVFCKDVPELDLGIIKINCGSIPDKQTEYQLAYDQGCAAFEAEHSCRLDEMESVTVTYAEFGKEPRQYNLFELCAIKNPYFLKRHCARLCGCQV